MDTTAAGDSFSAGYLAERLSGGSAQQALRGHRLAATVINIAAPSFPQRQCPHSQ